MDNKVIYFTIDNQKLTKIDKAQDFLVEKSIGYLYCVFNFIDFSIWENYSHIYAEFNCNRKVYTKEIQNNVEVEIPMEVINVPGFTVCVYGIITEDEKIIKRLTTNIETIKLFSSGKGLGTFINEGGSEDESITLIAKEALEISKQAEEQVKNIQNKILEVENTLSSIEEDIKTVSLMATDYQEFKENNLAEIESINEKILLLQNQTNNINSDLQTINENISKLNEKNTEYDINIANLQKEISSIQDNFSQIQDSIQELNNKNSIFEENFSKNEQKFSEINEQYENIVVEIDNLNNNLSNLNTLLNTSISTIEQEISELKEAVETNSKRIISKEDTDFIELINKNLVISYDEGALDENTGELISGEKYVTNFIDCSVNKTFCWNLENGDIFYYIKGEEEEIIFLNKDTIENSSQNNYVFTVSSGAELFRLVIENSSAIVEEGDIFEEEYKRYSFDTPLTEAIQKLIDQSIGEAIEYEY